MIQKHLYQQTVIKGGSLITKYELKGIQKGIRVGAFMYYANILSYSTIFISS